MSAPHACPDCLRRSRLLAHLAPYIEKVATGAPGSRSPELLRLSSEDLAEAVAPKIAAQVLAQVAAVPESRLVADLAAARCWACCRHDPRFPVGLHDARRRALGADRARRSGAAGAARAGRHGHGRRRQAGQHLRSRDGARAGS